MRSLHEALHFRSLPSGASVRSTSLECSGVNLVSCMQTALILQQLLCQPCPAMAPCQGQPQSQRTAQLQCTWRRRRTVPQHILSMHKLRQLCSAPLGRVSSTAPVFRLSPRYRSCSPRNFASMHHYALVMDAFSPSISFSTDVAFRSRCVESCACYAEQGHDSSPGQGRLSGVPGPVQAVHQELRVLCRR